MTSLFQRITTLSRGMATLLTLALVPLAANVAIAEDALPTEKQCAKLKDADDVTRGWCVAISRRQGNCLACHVIVTSRWPEALPPGGTIAPPLVAMKQRYPDAKKLRAQIWDPLSVNPNSVMPPFGKNKIVSDQDIDDIIAFLFTI